MQIDIKTTLKGFKWIQPFLIYFLLTSSCFSGEDKHPLLVQTKIEYWLEEFGKCEKDRKVFVLEIKQGTYGFNNGKVGDLTEKQLQECVVALAEAIKSNHPSLTTIEIKTATPKPDEEEENYRLSYKEREAKNIPKQKEFDKFFFENLFEAISSNNKIERIHFFSDRKISHEVSALFFKMLRKNKTIKLLSLNQCTFDERDILELAELLRNNKTILEFDLRGLENITLTGEKALLKALTHNRSMKWVYLFPISSESNDAYFTLINDNKSLWTYLDKFKFNKEDELKFSKVVSSNPNSEIYWSSDNNFTLEGRKALLKALIHTNSRKELKFSFVAHELCESLCEFIKKNKSIEKIYIRNCDFYEEEVLELAKAIGDNTTIKEIDLEGLGRYLTLKGKNALREVEEERTKTSWFSFKKKEPLIILLPNVPDQYLNQNRGR